MPCCDDHEREAREAGFRLVAGVDEVGRGALAGPVVAAAVVLDPDRIPPGLDDSKKLTAKKREALAPLIRESALAVAVARVEACDIDRMNILQATFAAMRQALAQIAPAPDLLLVDGNLQIPGVDARQKTIVGGDAVSVSIAAASILAKVTRDALMRDYDVSLSGYDFASHVGYGTPAHWAALRRNGPSPIHRLSFRGVCDPVQASFFDPGSGPTP